MKSIIAIAAATIIATAGIYLLTIQSQIVFLTGWLLVMVAPVAFDAIRGVQQ